MPRGGAGMGVRALCARRQKKMVKFKPDRRSWGAGKIDGCVS